MKRKLLIWELDWRSNSLLTGSSSWLNRSWNDEGILCPIEAGSIKEFLHKYSKKLDYPVWIGEKK